MKSLQKFSKGHNSANNTLEIIQHTIPKQYKDWSCIAPDKPGIKKYFSYFSMKAFVVATHEEYLGEVFLMSSHNICFHGEIRKNSVLYGLKKVSDLWSYGSWVPNFLTL